MAPAKRPGQSDNETQRRRLQDLLVFEADVKKGGAGTPRKIFANLLTLIALPPRDLLTAVNGKSSFQSSPFIHK